MSGWHEHHERAADAITARLEAGGSMLCAGHALAETYAVLTRLPGERRLSSQDALQVIEASIVRHAQVVSLDAAAYVELVRRAAASDILGGRIFDEMIGECALRAGAEELLTFNARHFRRVADRGLRIVVP